MKKNLLLTSGFILAFCPGYFIKSLTDNCQSSGGENDGQIKNQTKNNIVMKKVTGIGGIFFKYDNTEKIKEWYSRHLGFNTDNYGMLFEWCEVPDS